MRWATPHRLAGSSQANAVKADKCKVGVFAHSHNPHFYIIWLRVSQNVSVFGLFVL